MARSAHGHSTHQVFRLLFWARYHPGFGYTSLHLTCYILHYFLPSSYFLPNQPLPFVPFLGMALPAYPMSDVSRPTSVKPGPKVDPPFEETWAALEKCVEEGLIRSIGVSNFSPEKIDGQNQASCQPGVSACRHPNTHLPCLLQCSASLLQPSDGLVCCSCMLSNHPAVSSVLMIPCACYGFVICNAAAAWTVA